MKKKTKGGEELREEGMENEKEEENKGEENEGVRRGKGGATEAQQLHLDALGVLLIKGADVEGVGGVHLPPGGDERGGVLGEERRGGERRTGFSLWATGLNETSRVSAGTWTWFSPRNYFLYDLQDHIMI